MQCRHKTHRVDSSVITVMAEPEDSQEVCHLLVVEVVCGDCEQRFGFIGFEANYDPLKAGVSEDGEQLHAPISMPGKRMTS